MIVLFKRAVIICLTLMTIGCTSATAQTGAQRAGHTETGEASFYAMKYQSRKTASGEVFDQSAKTAAHRTLPFGTRVQVTNTANDKSVTVRVNDRGPFVRGRVIDLSQSAFKSIGNVSDGIIPVKIEVVE